MYALKYFNKNTPNTSIRETLYFHMITYWYIQPESRKKILDFGWFVLPFPPYFLDLSHNDFNLLRSLQNSLNEKKFSQEDQMKTFVENLLSLKTSWIYLRWINALHDEWLAVIQNNDEYTIDWN